MNAQDNTYAMLAALPQEDREHLLATYGSPSLDYEEWACDNQTPDVARLMVALYVAYADLTDADIRCGFESWVAVL